ncbi:potassium-transporting ATPase subunit KdpC [Duganella sp. Root336D2]|uniref:potassium-transporting ATPase subunit KdpC n=1 Tax=Duganella sp. Root336D2 TaxID=1736518 RepID=UPI0006F3F7B1|nr:potassium-transporting ATPase subunit KdpC [Duganella sp. Root336D2]KQV61549.1 potassium-transporting ATPase subunit C [Duganella sp. Root336D2]
MISTFRPALVLFGALTLATGVIYPLAVTSAGHALFPHQASGSIIEVDGKAIGSTLIGQQFTSPKYFWGRPSATGPMPYNANGSSASNQGPQNPAFTDAVKGRVDALKAADPDNKAPIPVDLVTASGSGLDPEISLAAAQYQLHRVADQRRMTPELLQKLVEQHSNKQYFGVFGEPRVNVLALNLALDGKTPHTR